LTEFDEKRVLVQNFLYFPPQKLCKGPRFNKI
jgi:hypothetical protein